MLNANSLYNYALIAALKDVSGGNFTQIFSLFARPIISDMGLGQQFDPKQFLQLMQKRYGIEWTENVVANIQQYLEQAGLLQKKKIGEKNICICNVPRIDDEGGNKVNKKLNALVADFKSFISACTSLSFTGKSDEELLDILTGYLSVNDWVEPDVKPRVDKTEGGQHSEEEYVCARFIASLRDSDTLNFLSILSSNIKLGALLQDFSIPKGDKKSFQHQNIFLDNTLLLSYLGLCGNAAETNAKSLVDLLKDNGAIIYVYSHTVDEAINALKSLIAHAETERFGLTWVALNNGEVTHDFIDYVIRNFEEILADKDIIIKDTTNKTSDPRFAAIFSQLSFLESRPTARERDTLSVLYMMHMQRIERKNDVLGLQNIFITTNPKLVSAVTRYMQEDEAMGYDASIYANPFIVAGKMEFLLWLIYGNRDKEAADIPTMQLICSADKVRQLKPEIFKQAQIKISLLTKDKDKLNAMLQEPRYKQALADATFNNPGIADKMTTEEIVQALEKENKKEILALKIKHGKDLKQKEAQITALQKRIEDNALRKEIRVNRIMMKVSERRHNFIKWLIRICVGLINLCAVAINIWSTKIGVPLTLVFILSSICYFVHSDWLIRKLQDIGIEKAIKKEIKKADLTETLDELSEAGRVDWKNCRIKELNSLLPIE